MRTGRPRSYDRRISVNTNIEADLYEFGKDDLGIPACEALAYGYIGRIDADLIVRKDIDADALDRYYEIRERVFRDLVTVQKKEQDIISRVSGLANEVRSEASVKPHPAQPTGINWDLIPEDQRIPRYIQTIMPEDTRAFWISEYNKAEEEDRFDVASSFAEDLLDIYREESEKPVKITDKNSVRKTLQQWADSARGV